MKSFKSPRRGYSDDYKQHTFFFSDKIRKVTQNYPKYLDICSYCNNTLGTQERV